MQNGQVIAYTSRVLTLAEAHYVQIKKELLATRFDTCTYIYSRDVVRVKIVKTDHKPLGGHSPQSTQLSITMPSVNAPSPSKMQLRD